MGFARPAIGFPVLALALAFATTNPGVVRHGPNMHQVRSGHTATLLPDGEVLVAGGMVRNGEFLDSAEAYAPQTNTFVPVGKMSSARVGHAAAALPDGRVLVAGGWGLSRAPIDSAEIFDPKSRRFEPIGHMTTRRAGARATTLAGGRVLITGGEGPSGMQASAEIFDPRTRSFQPTGPMSDPRAYHTATLLADGRVLVAGGALNWQHPTSSADIFDPATGKFAAVSPMRVVRYKHAAVLLRDGRVLIAGGSDGRDWNGTHASAELFDPATKSFVPTGSMTHARFKLTMAVLLPDGRAFVGGGEEGADVYDPATGQFNFIPADSETKRYFASVTALQDGRILMAGGYPRGNDTPTSATWIFQPREATDSAEGTAPCCDMLTPLRGGSSMSTVAMGGRRPRSQAKLVSFLIFGLVTVFVTYMKNRGIFDPGSEVAQHFAPGKLFLAFHASFAAIAMTLGAFQFSNRLRARYLKLHRVLGYVYVVSVFIGAPMAIPLSAKIDTPSLTAASVVQAFGWMLCTAIALYCVRSGNIAQHRRWMIRGYPFAMVFTVARILIPIPPILRSGFTGIEIVVWSTIALAAFLPSVLLEWRSIFPRPLARAAATGD